MAGKKKHGPMTKQEVTKKLNDLRVQMTEATTREERVRLDKELVVLERHFLYVEIVGKYLKTCKWE